MGLVPGEKVGPYDVVAPLGKGGMGEVYRARDPRLSREVAIKALPAEVAQDPDRRARFEREAQLLASLNHPYIAAIHGLEEAGGAKYLVLELVHGRTLGEVIGDGPLPPDEAAALALQIAEALGAAHEKGIIHRDLKPGNVMVTADHQVKLLDFGLGKSIESDASASSSAHSPTMTIASTQAGLILGTAAYMSPEQAKGRPADRRSDVWGFGCLLYEMLAGKPAFEGEDVTEILAHVVRGEPDWSRLPPGTPASLRALCERCLAKDRAKRLSDMSVVRFVLEERAAVAAAIPPAARAQRWPLIAALVIAAVLATAGVTRFLGPKPAASTGVTRLSVVLPYGDELRLTNFRPVAISPDGATIVYVARNSDNVTQLYRRALDTGETAPIPDTDGARTPFFSPDGRWIGFFAQGKVKKVSIDGTGVATLADASDARGGCWAPDGTIYFAPTNMVGLSKVSASGGETAVVTTPDRSAGEISHRWPHMLPDGKSLLYTVWAGPGTDEHSVVRLDLGSGARSVLIKGGDDGSYVAPGHLVYGRLDNLLAVPWNPGERAPAASAPITLHETPRMENEGGSAYDVSPAGTLVHVPGGPDRLSRQIVWVDRSGHEEPVATPARDFEGIALSPDGKLAAVQISSGTTEIWLYDFARGTMTPFEVSAAHSSQAPVWSADGRTIFYRGTRNGQRNIYAKAADGTSAEVRLSEAEGVVQSPTSVSADGKWLFYTEGGASVKGRCWVMSLDGSKTAHPILDPGDIDGQISPDGRWLSFESGRSGQQELYVTPFPGPGPSRQVSVGGGVQPLWSRDGRELFYSNGASVMVVDMSGAVGTPRVLHDDRYRPSLNANTAYGISADGKRFLRIRQTRPEGPLNHIDVVLGWADQLKK